LFDYPTTAETTGEPSIIETASPKHGFVND
jgi:hypothetical protein